MQVHAGTGQAVMRGKSGVMRAGVRRGGGERCAYPSWQREHDIPGLTPDLAIQTPAMGAIQAWKTLPAGMHGRCCGRCTASWWRDIAGAVVGGGQDISLAVTTHFYKDVHDK